MKVTRQAYCGCLYYSANALSRMLTRLAAKEFRTAGVAPSYGFILMTVNREPGITSGRIADVVQLQPSTITRLLDKLEREGYVYRTTVGKYMKVFPTVRGARLQHALKASWLQLHRRYTEILGEQASRKLTSSIATATTRLEDR